MKADKPLTVIFYANNKVIGESELVGNSSFEDVVIPFENTAWKGEISTISIEFKGKKKTTIIIDQIKVQRNQNKLTN